MNGLFYLRSMQEEELQCLLFNVTGDRRARSSNTNSLGRKQPEVWKMFYINKENI